MERLLFEGIIESSRSPWCAQVLVVKNQQKRRLVIDYSQTVNRFTFLDAYPLPRIEDIVHAVAKDKYYSSLDLRSAHHQTPLRADEKAFTALRRLYQYKRFPFGVTNGVSAFQRVMDDFIERHQLKCMLIWMTLPSQELRWKNTTKI